MSVYRLVYKTDGSLEGLLTAIRMALLQGDEPAEIRLDETDQATLFDSDIPVLTDLDTAEQLLMKIVERLGASAYENVKTLFLSEDPRRGGVAFRYLQYTLAKGQRSLGHLAHPAVADAEDIMRQVEKEAHFMIQFIRFSEIKGDGRFGRLAGQAAAVQGVPGLPASDWPDLPPLSDQPSPSNQLQLSVPGAPKAGLFYSHIQPKASVLPLIMGHFAARYNIQAFIIHDSRHGLAGFFDTQRWWLSPDDQLRKILNKAGYDSRVSLSEDGYEELWRVFYRTLTIKERKNPVCQRNLMPKRFWGDMCEQRLPYQRQGTARAGEQA